MKSVSAMAALCGILMILTSCKKNENNTSSPARQNLLNGKWQLTAYTGTTTYMGKDTTADFFATLEPCDKDDFITFYDNGTCTEDENTNKCAKDQQIESGTWYLLDSDTRLSIADSNPDTFSIASLTASELKLQSVGYNSSGTPITWIRTWKNIK